MIPIGAINPLSAYYRPLVWVSRTALIAAIIFTVAAATQILAASFALNLALGCAATVMTLHICLANRGELALLQEIGRASAEERKALHLAWEEETPFSRLLQCIKKAVDADEAEFCYHEQVDTDVAMRKSAKIDSLATYNQKALDDLLTYFET